MRFWKTWFRRAQDDRQLDAELQFHLDSRAEALRAQGLSPAEARRRARLEFGGVDQISEECRDSRPARWLYDLAQDLHYAWRMMKKSPLVSAAAVLSLALGIGANTAIFSLLDAILLRELPVAKPGELVVLNWQTKQGFAGRRSERFFERYSGSIQPPGMVGNAFSYAAYEALHAQAKDFAPVAAFLEMNRFSVAARGNTHAVSGQLVSGSYFPMLGIEARVGRLLSAEDDRAGAPATAVVSHRFYERALGADPAQIGQVIRVNNVAATVVGVTPPSFYGHEVGAHPDITLTLPHLRELDPEFVKGMGDPFTNRTSWAIQMLARLRDPAMPLAQLETRLSPLLLSTLETVPVKPELIPRLRLEPAARGISGLRRGINVTFGVLLGSTMLVLLIASANVANLLLARAMGRRREIAVRLSMGASRSRLWRQISSEFLLLAVLGATASLLIAYLAPAWLVTLLPSRGEEELTLPLRFDWRLLLSTAGFALGITFLFGAIPAWRATRLNVTGALKENSGSLGADAGRGRLGKLLIVGQVALSLLLLAAAGMFVRTLDNLHAVDLGFVRDRIVLFTLNAAQVGYGAQQRPAFYERTARELERIAGVESVSASLIRPLMGGGYWDDVSSPKFETKGRKTIGVGVHMGLPGFASTLGVKVLAGRDLDERDGAKSPKVMVVNETFAREAYGGRNPVGESVMLGDPKAVSYQIVGLVRDGRYSRLHEKTATVYVAAVQQETMPEQMTFAVRTRTSPAQLLPLVRAAVARVEPNIPLVQLRTLDDQVDEFLRPERLLAILGGTFALLALALSAVGIFGVMAYQAGRRRQEIGVRLALGAGRGRILSMVLRESVVTVLCGILLGLPLALLLPKLVDNLLYGLKASDPRAFLAAALVLLATALAAAWIPAWRAARLDPVAALREE
ncbi:MAG: ABC transporter permease [Bryobacteraceae bacterium]|nr:ABC transporter permease [Bryobacteraceae bacterium]